MKVKEMIELLSEIDPELEELMMYMVICSKEWVSERL